jgi:hypothetical protein
MQIVNHLKPSVSCMYHLLKRNKTLDFAYRVYLYVPHGSHNKQRLFP